MSSLHLSIYFSLFLILIRIQFSSSIYFTQSNYELWCEENVRSGSSLLYPNRIPIGIYRISTIKHLTFNLIDNHADLFAIKTKRIGDFYFLLLNITRPFDINREYQDVYTLQVQANILTLNDNQTEQAEIRLRVADSNDNDGVFDMDFYEQNFSHPIDNQHFLIRFHASDADEIQNAQIIYEMASSTANDTFSLHPFTGELFLTNKKNHFENEYQFEIFAYDRHRKRGGYGNMNTKARVRLRFNSTMNTRERYETITTIINETIRFQPVNENYLIEIDETKNWNFHNVHQPLISVRIVNDSQLSFEMFLLNSSSPNVVDLFIDRQSIYVNRPILSEYRLHLLICFFNRLHCQYSTYRYIPIIDLNLFQLKFEPLEAIELEENLPIDSFISRIQLQQSPEIDARLLTIHYRLLNDDELIQFYIEKQTGIIRLAERLQSMMNYTLDIQADIRLANRRYSIETSMEIFVRDINKFRPKFINETPSQLLELPYQFQAIDFDRNKETNGRITYELVSEDKKNQECPFMIDPDNGTLSVRSTPMMETFHLQIIAFDWGRPVSLETRINVRVHLSSNRRLIVKRDARTRAYARRWRKKSTTAPATALLNTTTSSVLASSTSSSSIESLFLDMGFSQNLKSYRLSEDAGIGTIIDRLKIENGDDNAFFYTINETSVPFAIDQNDRTLKVISTLDRERQDRYVFEIELRLKSTYALKFQSPCQNESLPVNVRYTNRYFQKIQVIIDINDVNDHSPVCDQFHARIEVEENQVQTNIFRVRAHDPDLGENGTIDYGLLGYEDHFSIDSRSGQIDLIRAFDREENPFVLVYIIASDRGREPQLQSICMTLHVTIRDINDNIPQFSSAPFRFYLFADMSRYAVFGQVHATDRDENPALSFSLDSNPYLYINSKTGHLRLKNSLHRLIDQILNVTVTVNDGRHTNRTLIHIYIQPIVQAQQPILIHEPAYGVTINESMRIGSIVSNVFRRILPETNIDNVELRTEENTTSPFEIDQQGKVVCTDLAAASEEMKSTHGER